MKLGEALVLLHRLLGGSAVIVGAAHKARAETRVDGGLSNAVPRKIHVEHRRDAAGKVLQYGELGEHVYVFRRELRFLGENLFREPPLQGQIVRQ
ncbi:hypothetical protein SDC9_82586 [bioreactor metagenome]|uniref:Uncharacterized protein n=1 Tax=bioreactor metagenome TaxID=1076179 RepID=A0A644Z7I8_9ZZZZ